MQLRRVLVEEPVLGTWDDVGTRVTCVTIGAFRGDKSVEELRSMG